MTAEKVAEYIIGSGFLRLQDGSYYIHVNADGELVERGGVVVSAQVGDISEWEHDDSPERFCREYETISNPDFMAVCQVLADKVSELGAGTAKWLLIEGVRGDQFETELDASSQDEAVRQARVTWEKLSLRDRKCREYAYVARIPVDEDGVPDCSRAEDIVDMM